MIKVSVWTILTHIRVDAGVSTLYFSTRAPSVSLTWDSAVILCVYVYCVCSYIACFVSFVQLTVKSLLYKKYI